MEDLEKEVMEIEAPEIEAMAACSTRRKNTQRERERVSTRSVCVKGQVLKIQGLMNCFLFYTRIAIFRGCLFVEIKRIVGFVSIEIRTVWFSVLFSPVFGFRVKLSTITARFGFSWLGGQPPPTI